MHARPEHLAAARARSYWFLAFALPALLFVAIVCFAPNFRHTGELRSDPFGGDYLQEWVGGTIVASEHRVQLYDLEVARSQQHDSRLGFEWPESRYFPMVYPPFYYLLVSPLTTLSYTWAAACWLLLMIAALCGTLLLLRSLDVSPWLAAGACLCYPVLLSLATGQKGTLLLLLLTATFCLLRLRRPGWAGVVFGCLAFKPHLAIALGMIMLVKGQWRFLGGCAVTLFTWLALCCFLGFDVCQDYVNVCLSMGNYMESGGYHLDQGFSLWSACQLTLGPAPAKIAAALTSAAVLIGLLSALSGKLDSTGDRFPWQFAAIMVATILVAPHCYAYDLSILVLPAALILTRHLSPASSTSRSAAAREAMRSDSTRRILVLALFAAILFGTPWLALVARTLNLPAGVLLLTLLFAMLAFECRAAEPVTVTLKRLQPQSG